MKRKNFLFMLALNLVIANSAPFWASSIDDSAESKYEILTDEELSGITLEELRIEYQKLASLYSKIVSEMPTETSEMEQNFDLSLLAPGQNIENVYAFLGEPTDIYDLGSSKSYEFSPDSSIYYYGLNDLIFSVFTDASNLITYYTFSGSCSIDSGMDIYNDIVSDYTSEYGEPYTFTNDFGVSGLEWDISNSSEYNTLRIFELSGEKFSITIAYDL